MGIFSWVARGGAAIATGGTSEILLKAKDVIGVLIQSLYFWWALSLAVVFIGTWWHVSGEAERNLELAKAELAHLQEVKIAEVTNEITIKNAANLKAANARADYNANLAKDNDANLAEKDAQLEKQRLAYQAQLDAMPKPKPGEHAISCPVVPAELFKPKLVDKRIDTLLHNLKRK